MQGIQINDDMRLDREADAMGAKAAMTFNRPILGPLPEDSRFKVIRKNNLAGQNTVTLEMANRFPKVHVTVKHDDLHKFFKKQKG